MNGFEISRGSKLRDQLSRLGSWSLLSFACRCASVTIFWPFGYGSHSWSWINGLRNQFRIQPCLRRQVYVHKYSRSFHLCTSLWNRSWLEVFSITDWCTQVLECVLIALLEKLTSSETVIIADSFSLFKLVAPLYVSGHGRRAQLRPRSLVSLCIGNLGSHLEDIHDDVHLFAPACPAPIKVRISSWFSESDKVKDVVLI